MNKDLINYLNETRRNFSGKPLRSSSVKKDPIEQFNIWIEEAINSQLIDPNAMSITTVNENGQPSTRIVYLRGINEKGFIFYTNYKSNKGASLENNNQIALNFFFPELDRQIRIEGIAEKMSTTDSDVYFSQRPRESQIGAWASSQSEAIENRAVLSENVNRFTEKFKGTPVPRPKHWGRYVVVPSKIEFWQGRPNRLHDRILFSKTNTEWKIERLAP
jgi:pyridoxamine 5'-phosphate oxidase